MLNVRTHILQTVQDQIYYILFKVRYSLGLGLFYEKQIEKLLELSV